MTSIQPDPSEQVGRFLLGIADLFEQLIPKRRKFGRDLIARAKTGKRGTER
jgi:hypothetical protein